MNIICKNKKVSLLVSKNKYNKAIGYLKKLISEEKNIVLNSLILSKIYYINKNLTLAIDTLETLISSKIQIDDNSLNFEIYKALGDYYYKKENFSKAFINYQIALAINKNDSVLLQKIALIYLEMHNYEKAENILIYLNNNSPENISVKCLLVYLYIESKKMSKAESLLNELWTIKPVSSLIRFYTGYYYYSLQKYKDAIENFKESTNDKGLKFKANYYIGLSYFSLNEYKNAIHFFELAKKYIEFENTLTLDLYYFLSLSYEYIEEYEKALCELKRIYNINPEYKDIKTKLSCEKYKSLAEKEIEKINSFSVVEFYKFVQKFLKKLYLKILQLEKINEKLIVVFVIAKKNLNSLSWIIEDLLIKKNEKYVFIFMRENLKEHEIKELLKQKDENISNVILFSSSQFHPTTMEILKHNEIKVIPPFEFCDLIGYLKI